MRPNF